MIGFLLASSVVALVHIANYQDAKKEKKRAKENAKLSQAQGMSQIPPRATVGEIDEYHVGEQMTSSIEWAVYV